jgi:hypothetical protein
MENRLPSLLWNKEASVQVQSETGGKYSSRMESNGYDPAKDTAEWSNVHNTVVEAML